MKYDRKRPDIAFALSQGWRYVRRAGSGHLIFRHPDGGVDCVLPCTLGGGRGDRNGIAWIKRNTPREATA
jgi:hypothetical protein